jgi:hypothetical protein
MEKYSARLVWASTLLLWAITVLARIKYNGLIYGFDYGLYHPDGALYSFKTLTLLGHSQSDAATQVAHWYSLHSFKLKDIDPASLYFQNNPSWTIYQSRIVYPLLSMPFVALLDLKGMLVVPILSLGVLLFSTLYIGRHFNQQLLALVLVATFTISTTISRWMLINATDSLLVAITSLYVLVCIKRPRPTVWFLLTFLSISLATFTRFSLLLWFGFGAVLLIRKNYLRALFIFLLSSLGMIPTLLSNFQSAVLPNEGNLSMAGKLAHLPKSMVRIGFYDIAQLGVLDRILLIAILCTLVVAIKNLKSESSLFFVIVLGALWITAGINGTPGVNFRYELPILPLMAWVVLENTKLNLTNSRIQRT